MQNNIRKKQVAILGSTGSIGTQALDVIRNHPEKFEVYALTANRQADLLARQAREFGADSICIADEIHYPQLKEDLKDLPAKVWAGQEALAQIATAGPVDIVLTAMVGYSGLKPTIEAIKAGKTIALANKETLVVAGELIMGLAEEKRVPILPVDSEHSAIFQCLQGEDPASIEKIYLTASGGPFRKHTLDQLKKVSSREALRHPNWSMGAKVTIDSASLMNKGFEMIEAKWLFGVEPSQIEVLVHPQSIIHSMVLFKDGSIKAQLGAPDMRMPIQYALGYPERLTSDFPRVDFNITKDLTFEQADTKRFRNLAFAFEAVEKAGNMPCILNAANEIVVDAFLHDKISFLGMSDVIEKTMQAVDFIPHPVYEDYVETDTMARIKAKEIMNTMTN